MFFSTLFRFVWFLTLFFLLFQLAIQDWQKRILPNRLLILLTIDSLFSFLFFPEVTLLSRLLGLLFSGIVLLVAVLFPGYIGGGDVKLLAVMGFLLGGRLCLLGFLAGLLCCGLYCAIFLLQGKLTPHAEIALGAFLCAGFGLVLLFCLFVQFVKSVGLHCLMGLLKYLL